MKIEITLEYKAVLESLRGGADYRGQIIIKGYRRPKIFFFLFKDPHGPTAEIGLYRDPACEYLYSSGFATKENIQIDVAGFTPLTLPADESSSKHGTMRILCMLIMHIIVGREALLKKAKSDKKLSSVSGIWKVVPEMSFNNLCESFDSWSYSAIQLHSLKSRRHG